jgi:hypothetical protein
VGHNDIVGDHNIVPLPVHLPHATMQRRKKGTTLAAAAQGQQLQAASMVAAVLQLCSLGLALFAGLSHAATAGTSSSIQSVGDPELKALLV